MFTFLTFFTMTQQPVVGQGLLIIEASRSHSVGLPWTSDQPDADRYLYITTFKIDIHGPDGIGTRIPSK
jgi:hypothetical protein